MTPLAKFYETLSLGNNLIIYVSNPLKFAIYTVTKFVNRSFESETIQKLLKSIQKSSAIAET